MSNPADLSPLVQAFDRQAHGCRTLGAIFTAQLVEVLGAELRCGGPLCELLPSWPHDAWLDAVPLRICGALHALALGGDPALSALYPPRAAAFDGPAIVRALNRALSTNRPHFEEMLGHPPQTNEIGRAAALIGGFSEIARSTGMPLALTEIGASAGLNLRWDRYRYVLGETTWGDSASPVRIVAQWRGAPPTLAPHVEVVCRHGCDLAPIDPRSPEQSRRLKSYVWPEQVERLARLDAALDLAKGDSVQVEQADAADWVERQLSQAHPGCVRVLYHSIVWQYLPPATKSRVGAAIDAAGQRATRDAPFAWLSFEFEVDGVPPRLSLTQWPGGLRRILATAHPHGAHVDWTAFPAAGNVVGFER